MPDKLLVVVTVPLPIRTLTGTPLQIYPHPHPTLGFIPLGFIQTRSIQNENVMFSCWQCSQYPGIVATSSTVAARTPFCVYSNYCSQLSIRRPATKETRPEAKSSLSVSLLETSLEVGTGTRYWGRRQVASIAHGVAATATGRVKRVESRSNHRNPGRRVPSTGPVLHYSCVPVNYITSLRVFTDSTSSSTGRIRARFGGSFHSRNRRHRWRRHFLRVRQY